MSFDVKDLIDARVTVMGLGLHGGGLASARYCAENGARVTVTDLRSDDELAGPVGMLKDFDIHFVFGHHDMKDFENADIVIKNPAVKSDSPYLGGATRVETDLSMFLALCNNPVIGITGSKGKSTVASAIAYGLRQRYSETKLGGNITISPLSFLSELQTAPIETPVVLELSSWQLADLRGKGILKPKVSVVTVILPDHQDRYEGMDDYVDDKLVLVENQTKTDTAVLDADDPYAKKFWHNTGAKVCWYAYNEVLDSANCSWLDGKKGRISYVGSKTQIVPEKIQLLGQHARKNLLAAATALYTFGVDPKSILKSLSSFPGVPHRMERVGIVSHVSYFNDSAATIPQATVVAAKSITGPLILIAGGTDKNLDFSVIDSLRTEREHIKSIILLEGSGTDKMIPELERSGLPYSKPHDSLHAAVAMAHSISEPGDTVVFSPGCTSFGMFKNEFHRGDIFREIVLGL